MQFNSLAQRLCFVPQLRHVSANQTHGISAEVMLGWSLYDPIAFGEQAHNPDHKSPIP